MKDAKSTSGVIWLNLIAGGAVVLSLVTFIFGALVTTKNAGMAFTDWPTSDGYLMVTYPWLRDFATNWDKFLEHGHRLAGMTIGLWTILLVVVAWRCESRRWVRWLSASILLGVICQGLLGGFRVQLDERGLAMLHGMFAAIVFCLMGTLVVVTGRGWQQISSIPTGQNLSTLKITSLVTLALAALQYVLGSFIRHRGMALHEHRGLGILVGILGVVILVQCWRTGIPWLRRAGVMVFLAVFGQFLLGFAAWFAKYGIPSLGYVATADSILQVTLRTSHMVWGTVTMMALATCVLKIARVISLSPQPRLPEIELRKTGKTLWQTGGAST